MERKYKTFYDYREARKDRKRSVSFVLIVGLALIAVSVVFLILYETVGAA